MTHTHTISDCAFFSRSYFTKKKNLFIYFTHSVQFMDISNEDVQYEWLNEYELLTGHYFYTKKFIKLNFQHAKREHHLDVDAVMVMVNKYLLRIYLHNTKEISDQGLD